MTPDLVERHIGYIQQVMDATGRDQSGEVATGQVDALFELAKRLSEPRRTSVLEDALMAATRIGSSQPTARRLAMLSESLPKHLFDRALEIAETVENDQDNVVALSAFLKTCPGPDTALLARFVPQISPMQRQYALRLIAHAAHLSISDLEGAQICESIFDVSSMWN